MDSQRFKLVAVVLPMVGTPIHFYDRLYWEDYGGNTPEPEVQNVQEN